MADFGRATVFAMIGTTQSCPVSSQWTVTLPVAVAPAVVDVYESQIRATAIAPPPTVTRSALVPSGVPKPPDGPAVIWRWREAAMHESSSKTIGRNVVTPTPP